MRLLVMQPSRTSFFKAYTRISMPAITLTVTPGASELIYRMARKFGGKIFWRIAENMSFGEIYFGG